MESSRLNLFIAHVICLFALTSVLSPAIAADQAYKIVTAPEVKKMRDDGKLIVHTLSRIEYQVQHIPGSINIPVSEIASSKELPKDKQTPILFYCAAPECYHSRLASIKAVSMGYKNVFWFEGGIAEWRKMQYDMAVDKDIIDIEVPMLSPAEVDALIHKNKNLFVLDGQVKWTTTEQMQFGGKNPFGKTLKHVNASIPVLELDKKLAAVPMNREILIFDTHMKQSVIAAKYLKHQGRQVIGVLKGGITRWIEEGYPVVNRPATAKIETAKRWLQAGCSDC